MDLLTLLKMAAATWYIAYAISSTHGPFGVFEWIRKHAPLGGLTSCIVCLSVWVALILALNPDSVLVNVVAVAGVALWLHGLSNWRFAND